MHTSNVVVAFALAVHDRMAAAMESVGLDGRELAALTLVSAEDGCPVGWLSSRVGLTHSGTVRLLDRLTARGLLRRGPTSGRHVPLHLTNEGRAQLDHWASARDDAIEQLLAAVPTEQRAPLVAALGCALEAAPRVRAEADATCRACTWPACGHDCPVDRSVPGRSASTRRAAGASR
jgi:DNA-binding MarR family transcriptional regulator